MSSATPNRSTIEIRPRGAGAMTYSPQRDLGYLYPHAMREAVWALDKPNWRDMWKGLLESTGTTEEQLAEGVKLFTKAHALFVGNPAIQEPTDALRDVGFLDLPDPVRLVIYASLGETMMGGFFVAVRDVTVQGELPPNFVDIATFIGAGRAMREKLAATKSPEMLYMLLAGHLEAAVVEREESRRLITKLRGDLAKAKEENTKLSRRRGIWQTLQSWLASRTSRKTPTSTENSSSSES